MLRSGFGSKGGRLDAKQNGFASLEDKYPLISSYLKSQFGTTLVAVVDFSKGYTSNPVTSIRDQVSDYTYTLAAGGNVIPQKVDQSSVQTLYFDGTARFDGIDVFSNYIEADGITVISVASVAQKVAEQAILWDFENGASNTREFAALHTFTGVTNSSFNFLRTWFQVSGVPAPTMGGFTRNDSFRYINSADTDWSIRSSKIQRGVLTSIKEVTRTGAISLTSDTNAAATVLTGSAGYFPKDFNFPFGDDAPLVWQGFTSYINYALLVVIADYVDDTKIQDTMKFLKNYYQLPDTTL